MNSMKQTPPGTGRKRPSRMQETMELTRSLDRAMTIFNCFEPTKVVCRNVFFPSCDVFMFVRITILQIKIVSFHVTFKKCHVL